MIDENLTKAIRDNKLVLFIGAGASIPLNHPSWKGLISGILDDLNSDFSESSSLNFINLKRYLNDNIKSPLEILNIIENESDNGDLYKTKAKEYVHKVLNKINTENSLHSNVHKLLWELSSKIVTTNYDQIIEANIPDDRTIDVFGNENIFMSLKSQKDNAKFLYKIHGDFKNPKTIVLFESDYKSIYSKNNANEDAISTFFKNYTLLFLGFSLSDPFINELFTKIKNLYNNHTIANHFIFSTSDTGDFSKYDVKKIFINNWDDSLVSYLNELVKSKIDITSSIKDSLDTDLFENDTESIFLTIKYKTNELKKDPGNNALASEIHNLKSKVYELLYKDLDDLNKIEGYKNTHIEMLFEAIYGNDNLANETIIEINKIRNNVKDYAWYERSQLVSSLACSLIIFNRADASKISLLIDFINDGEEKVWQRSLTYLVLVLNHLGHKWVKYPFLKKKIELLTLNSKVQQACQRIMEYLLVFGVESFNFSENFFREEYFQKPSNYFFPFFTENNPLLDGIYDNYTGDNIEEFINILEKTPLPDSLKYLFCNTKKDDSKSISKQNKKQNNNLRNHLFINENFHPYAGIIQEFASFLINYPSIQHKKLLDTQIKLTSTPLKDYILNEKEKFRALGIYFLKEKNLGQAIINFNKYLELEPKDHMILYNLETTYIRNKEVDKAKDIVFKIKDLYPTDIDNLLNLIKIYIDEKKYKEGFEISDECIAINKNNAEVYHLRAWLLYNEGNFEKALSELEISKELNYRDKVGLNDTFSTIHFRLKNYETSLKYINEAIKLNASSSNIKDADLYYNRSQVYEALNNYGNAIKDIDFAISIKQDPLYTLDKIFILLKTGNLKESKPLFNKIYSSQKNNSEYYNAKANYHRLEGNYGLALQMIEKAIEISKSNGDNSHYTGTMAAIYSSLGDYQSFYKYLEESLNQGADAEVFLPDIKIRHQDDIQFKDILGKFNQTI
ncbi:Tetratricopeptide repeat-containing protein [Chryseobacterium carnipullorum]|uniref:SIR2 family protein n=1 Tax=Chryseobacterium carnipullorum TaxID=1124835 RepID=UPI000918E3F1|nr:SIR2 family protein [Chryseobacterium carnipullorum]SHL56136.1 Tetratricopeptide repeat-containing protein [Chryseobacterium carnipullorum]